MRGALGPELLELCNREALDGGGKYFGLAVKQTVLSAIVEHPQTARFVMTDDGLV
ncbi:hypothetical protein [uncultured Microbacterium sp.]|uniref:hypothetical protein n=1 Tax=uncultured Microbacterium sp. TaxID=191216 RepID=UPI0026322920|nr:hypothetical protein [uncultured Microbacterium sp.]